MSKTSKRVKTFSVGDRVSWESQAGGHWKKKIGTVVEVVPAHASWQDNPTGVVGTRGHESYVVEVDTVKGGKRQRQTRYWPVVSNLRLVRRGSTSPVETAPSVARPAPEPEVPQGLRDIADAVDEDMQSAEEAGDPYLAGIMGDADVADTASTN